MYIGKGWGGTEWEEVGGVGIWGRGVACLSWIRYEGVHFDSEFFT